MRSHYNVSRSASSYRYISIRSPTLKQKLAEADTIANAMGMTLSTAINVFVRQMVFEKAIPFRIHLDNEREIALKKGKQVLKEIQEQSILNGTSYMTMDEIDAEIMTYRQETEKVKC